LSAKLYPAVSAFIRVIAVVKKLEETISRDLTPPQADSRYDILNCRAMSGNEDFLRKIVCTWHPHL